VCIYPLRQFHPSNHQFENRNMKSVYTAATVFGLVSAINGLVVRGDNVGCDKALPADIKPGDSVNLTMTSASGVSPRKYRLHLPKSYAGTKKVPLILSYHGRTRDALNQEELSRFSEARYGFEGISVYPQGVPLVGKVRFSNSK
jgi:poly(3-hydroxybutyrate) depolymerase